jgi:hypothetical protein
MGTPSSVQSPNSIVNTGQGVIWANPSAAAGSGVGSSEVLGIVSFSITSNVASFVTSTNNSFFIAGQTVTLINFFVGTYFNGQLVTILSSGLSSTTFSVVFSHADVASTQDIGLALPSTTYATAAYAPYIIPTLSGGAVAYTSPIGPDPAPVSRSGHTIGLSPYSMYASLRFAYGFNGDPFGQVHAILTTTTCEIPTLPLGAVVTGIYPVATGTAIGGTSFFVSWTSESIAHTYGFFLNGTNEVGPSMGTDLSILSTTTFTHTAYVTSVGGLPGNPWGDSIQDFGIAVAYTYSSGTPVPVNQIRTLSATNFNLALAANSSVTGVKVNMVSGLIGGSGTTLTAQLTLNGTPIGNVKSFTIGDWATPYSLGSDWDLWGVPNNYLTALNVNGATGLGVNIGGELPSSTLTQLDLNSLTLQVFSILTLTLPSFSLMATYSSQGDVAAIPTASLQIIPSTIYYGTPITLVWNTSGIIQVEITANNGVDPAIDSGLMSTTGLGTFFLPNGVSVTTVFTLSAYDTVDHVAVTTSIQATVLDSGFGLGFGTTFSS